MAAVADGRWFLAALWGHCADADAGQPCGGQSGSADAAHGGIMNHWAFVIAAYGLTALGTAGVLLWSYLDMRRAEKAVADLETRK